MSGHGCRWRVFHRDERERRCPQGVHGPHAVAGGTEKIQLREETKMETPEQFARKRWAKDELDKLYPMVVSSEQIPATYPERSLYYRDEVKAAIDASLSRQAHEADAVKAAVNEALEQAAVIADSKFIAREDASLFIRGLKSE